MKTSKKIIISVSGFLLVYLIVGLFLLRDSVEITPGKRIDNYEEVKVEFDEKFSFSANWDIKIKQGVKKKVEIEKTKNKSIESNIENRGGVLYFENGLKNNPITKKMSAIITVPSIREIKADKGTTIYIESFGTDSLDLILEDSTTFIGKNNKFKYTSFKNSGTTTIQISDTNN